MHAPYNMQQNTAPQGSQSANVLVPSNVHSVPSNALPGALQVGGSASRPPASSPSTYTSSSPATLPPMAAPPMQTNASQYAQAGQTPSRSHTLHSHSRSSPGGMMEAGHKYIPFNQTPTQTPTSSNPKAFNLSNTHTPAAAGTAAAAAASAGPSHSPLNLTDIRLRAVSDANDTAQGTVFFSYSDTATNSNYLAPFPTYAYDWCKWPVMGGNSAGKIAVGSYLEDPHNFIQILDTHIVPQDAAGGGRQAAYGLEYSKVAEATCAYPVTRILWEPPSSQKASTDLLATSGDHLRLWSLPQSSAAHAVASNHINRSASANTRDAPTQKLQPLALLSNSKTPEHTAPLTSLDWNTLSPKLIITSSIDTTCTIWDIPTLTAKTQLIAHDKEVFDVRFCAGSVDVFVSCGADGSVRMFDLRSLEHSTIIYEPADKTDKSSTSPSSPTKSTSAASSSNNNNSGATAATGTGAGAPHSTPPPLLRLAASPHDAHLLATFASESNVVRILDVRQPGAALLELRGHAGTLNSVEWNPHRRGMLASGGDDSLVLVWDLLNASNQAQLLPASAGGASSASASASSSATFSASTGPGRNGGGGAVPSNGSVNGNAAASAASAAPQQQHPGAGGNGSTADAQKKGPFASWRCEYEVANVSWAPQSSLTAHGGDWLGVCAGRGVWGVKL